jgi:UDP-N-acetylglucosamine diphosphorylase / glucose-1-phosphate thymidylyltransferase / UDP-N-acetylgalactosamine diphosphorylase / glucosamine-1-phosphate N-acetyltransferase / galactosamine-1-phosphate N-acetyltransferase
MTAIRKAILLAAGRGKRLGELTAHRPKTMLEIADAPIIAHVLEGLAQAGIEQAIVVTGYLGEQIENFCRRFESNQLAITTVRQPTLNGTGGAMMAAMPVLGADPGADPRFVFGWGDVLMDHEFYQRFMMQANVSGYDLLLAVNRVRDPSPGAAVYVDAAMRVERIIEKPPPGTSTTNWNNAGLFASTTTLLDYVARLEPSPRGELELPAAIAAMIEDGRIVRAAELRGFWSDIGTPEDLERARKLFRPRGNPAA